MDSPESGSHVADGESVWSIRHEASSYDTAPDDEPAVSATACRERIACFPSPGGGFPLRDCQAIPRTAMGEARELTLTLRSLLESASRKIIPERSCWAPTRIKHKAMGVAIITVGS